MAKFSLSDLLKVEPSTTQSRSSSTEDIELIPIGEITSSKENFYSLKEIDELADTILLCGLMHNLFVERIADGTNILKSGHRRLLALKKLVADGHNKYALAPCKVVHQENEVMSEIKLIVANSTARDLSEYERTQQASRLKALLMQAKENGVKIPGRLRDIVADTMQVSKTKVAQMDCINNNLQKDLKQEFQDGKINFSTAYEMAKLPPVEQVQIHERLKDIGTVSHAKVKEQKAHTPPINEQVQNQSANKITIADSIKKMDIDEMVSFLYLNKQSTGLGLKRLREWLESEVSGDE